MYLIIGIIIVYILCMFVLSRFLVPHLGFKKDSLPKKLPKSMETAILKLKRKHKDPLDFAKATYDFFASKYCGKHLYTWLRMDLIFSNNCTKLWNRRGYLPCTHQNYLYRIFLVKSGRFKDDQIRVRHHLALIALHQDLQINHKGKWINVDVWAANCGVPFGKQETWFVFLKNHVFFWLKK